MGGCRGCSGGGRRGGGGSRGWGAGLGVVFDATSRAARLGAVGVCGDERAGHDAAYDVVEVPDLVQGAVLALNGWRDASGFG